MSVLRLADYFILAAGAAIVVVIVKRAISAQGKVLMDELARLTSEVAEARTVMSGAVILIGGLREQLLAAGTDPAKLAALASSLDEGSNALAAAVAANTPGQPEEPAL